MKRKGSKNAQLTKRIPADLLPVERPTNIEIPFEEGYKLVVKAGQTVLRFSLALIRWLAS